MASSDSRFAVEFTGPIRSTSQESYALFPLIGAPQGFSKCSPVVSFQAANEPPNPGEGGGLVRVKV